MTSEKWLQLEELNKISLRTLAIRKLNSLLTATYITEKSHANDAVAIAKHLDIRTFGDYTIKDCDYTTLYKQVRKKKRALHESQPRKGRKRPNRSAKRNAKNTKQVGSVKLFDKVSYSGQTAFVQSFAGQNCYLKCDDKYLARPNGNRQIPVKGVMVLHHNNNWLEKRQVI